MVNPESPKANSRKYINVLADVENRGAQQMSHQNVLV
jgi:hypothetical protein